MPEYIERESLLDIAKKVADMYSVTGLTSVHIIKAIEKAPTEDVETVKHGYWQWKECKCFCSICKEEGGIKHHYEDGTVDLYSFCPNCGAKMDKEEGAKGCFL